MTSCEVPVDPESRDRGTWVGRLAVLKSRGAPYDDPRVIECRQALAYHRVHRAVAAETGQLSRAGVDRLVVQPREAVLDDRQGPQQHPRAPRGSATAARAGLHPRPTARPSPDEPATHLRRALVAHG